MTRLLEGRIAIVTGAGRGIGRAHALELARHGARIVVNAFGVTNNGKKSDSPAHPVVAEIEALGGEAVVNGADVAGCDKAGAMVQKAIANSRPEEPHVGTARGGRCRSRGSP